MAKRDLLKQVEEQRLRVEELEDTLQEAENAKERIEINYNALKAEMERTIQHKEAEAEEKRRQLLKKVCVYIAFSLFFFAPTVQQCLSRGSASCQTVGY